MQEIWKDIKDYENLYKVSNLGNVLNVKRNLIRKKTISRDGYYIVSLSKNNKEKIYFVHRLVADAFLDKTNYKKYDKEKDNFLTINHINEDKLDNRASNLEWCTNKYNIKYSAHKKINYKKMVLEIKDYVEKNNIPENIKEDINKIIYRKRVKYNDGQLYSN